VLAAELRTLLCLSSGTEGLLWRLADELGVSDNIVLEAPSAIKRDHPRVRGLSFVTVPLRRPGGLPPGLRARSHSVRKIIKKFEAVFLSASSGKVITHEILIKSIAEQMGTAHEDEGIDSSLFQLKQIFVNGIEPYVPVLAFDTELALQVGERILDHAEQYCGYQRVCRAHEHGDVTLVIHFDLRELLAGRVPVVTFRSHVSDAEIRCLAAPQSAVFILTKGGHVVDELEAPYPQDWALKKEVVIALCYSSSSREGYTITNDRVNGDRVSCNLGWLDARELGAPIVHKESEGFIYIQQILSFERLLSRQECYELREMPTARSSENK